MKKMFVLLVLALSLVLIACSSASPTTAPNPSSASKPTEAPTTAVTNFPTGKFLQNGKANYGIVFNEDGSWWRFDGMFKVAGGTYSVNGNIYTETSNEDCEANVDFAYTFDGKTLTFNYVGNPEEDKCLHRTWDMNNVAYTLADESAESSAAALPEIKIDAKDFSYVAPEAVNAGWVRIILTNSGEEPHHVQFLRLSDGVTVDQFEEALKQAEGPALAMTKQVGGVGAIYPGGTAQAVINLPAGEYVILCLIPSPGDHVAHHAKGMIKSLTVQTASSTPASEPTADLTVHMKDFTYDLPDSLPAGPMTIKVINDGPEPHELNILRLEEGKSASDVMEFLGGAGGPPPFAPIGGMNGLDTGVTGYAELNLEPGAYVAICNIPSPKSEGHPHFTLGMIKQFTVGSMAGSNFPTGKFIKSGEKDYGLVFNQDGSFSVFSGDTIFVTGTYSADDKIFTETSNDGGCKTNVSFNYTFDGKNLTFTYVGNPADDADCTGRNADFNNVIYTLTK